jgi:hypothetical protein
MCVESLYNEIENLNLNYLYPSFLPFFFRLFLPPLSLLNFYVKPSSSYEFYTEHKRSCELQIVMDLRRVDCDPF